MMQTLSRWLLKQWGWQIQGQLPQQAQYLIIVAPHTSNWDFIVGLLARFALATHIHFLGKHSLFIKPWGWFFSAIGGTPVDRRKTNNLVDAVADLFKQDANYKLALAPEGTRSQVTRWKTGFYHIAYKAQVDIVPVALDFKLKQVIITNPLTPTGNIEQDMQQLIDFYRSVSGKYPKTIPDFHTDK